jgi:type I restriction enzyme M protein
VRDYLDSICAESEAIPSVLTPFEATLANLRQRFALVIDAVEACAEADPERAQGLADAAAALCDTVTPYGADRARLLADLEAFRASISTERPDTNEAQLAARRCFDPTAEAIRGLVKRVDLLYKLAARVADLCAEWAHDDALVVDYDRRSAGRLVKQLDEHRKVAVRQLQQAAYFHRQVAWLQDRFPRAELEAVPGLVKLVDRAEIAAADWSLTPGRYVGVAPPV